MERLCDFCKRLRDFFGGCVIFLLERLRVFLCGELHFVDRLHDFFCVVRLHDFFTHSIIPSLFFRV